MRSLLKLIAAMTRYERMALGGLTLVLILSFLMLLRSFYMSNTEIVPVQGGTYIEGAVGEVQPLNPWFTITNDVNRDLVSLIFSGLLKYDPQTGSIIDDLATMKVSDDNRVYTLKLKVGIQWHDATPKAPHPVTADDVQFTFTTIQNAQFPNTILQQNFRGVEIVKLDARTVQFRLSKPYAFFASNLTLGLLPKNAFDGIPVKKLDQMIDFGLHPIGAGPYQFVSLLQTDASTEVTLKRFSRPGLPEYRIDRIVMRVFPDYTNLLSDIMNLDGVRLVPRGDDGKPILPRRFQAETYTLPQYVGLFFNMDRDILADRLLRLGIELATNKQEIVDALHETKIVDTPLAEIDLTDWHYKFDLRAAQGALFSSKWNMPEKIRLQSLLERRETNAIGPLHTAPGIVYLDTGAVLTLTGSMTGVDAHARINGLVIATGATLAAQGMGTGTWLVRIPTQSQSGALHIGINLLKMTKADGTVIDSAYIERQTSLHSYQLATEEQRLVNRYLQSKNANTPAAQHIGIDDLYMDNAGYLRAKLPTEEPHTRVSDQGKPLRLTLLTSSTPATYRQIAEMLRKQWRAVGVEVTIDSPDTKKEFEERMLSRNYDILLFGQSLLDNLDSYPYWHSSQMQDKDPKNLKRDAFNLSQYASFEADALLTRIRETSNLQTREKDLRALNDVIKRDVPAVFLYSPLYVTAYDAGAQGRRLGKLALHADRLATVNEWYITTERRFVKGKSWWSFPRWLYSSFF